MSAPTQFVETNLLIAVMDDDIDAATAIAQEMLPSERRQLSEHADQMMAILGSFCTVCDKPIPKGSHPRSESRISRWTADGAYGQYHARCLPDDASGGAS